MTDRETNLGEFTADEMMAVAAARRLRGARAVFVGIGHPSTAANLARATTSPELVLVYESGCIGAKPNWLPLSIGDGILAETADIVVSVPEMFNYWLQAGRIDIGFLGAAQIDRFGNINTTVIGDYDAPAVRLPGAGGAPEIAACCGEVIVILRHSPRALVERVDFVTSFGFGTGNGDREQLGFLGRGPTTVITDIGVLTADDRTRELQLSALHPGRTADEAIAATGWALKTAPSVTTLDAPTHTELQELRALGGLSSMRT